MEDNLLIQAKALYKDRLRIALSTILIVFTVTFYVFFNPAFSGIGLMPPENYPDGIALGLAVVTSFNFIGFAISVFLMVMIFRFWQWAFLPGPATTYTLAVLEGLLGPKASIKQMLGKRFRVTLEDGVQFEVVCKTRDRSYDEWFSYRLVTSRLMGDGLREIALRHGLSFKDNRFIATISNEELHSRTFLLTKALIITRASV